MWLMGGRLARLLVTGAMWHRAGHKGLEKGEKERTTEHKGQLWAKPSFHKMRD